MFQQPDSRAFTRISAAYLDPADGRVTTKLVPTTSHPHMYGSYPENNNRPSQHQSFTAGDLTANSNGVDKSYWRASSLQNLPADYPPRHHNSRQLLIPNSNPQASCDSQGRVFGGGAPPPEQAPIVPRTKSPATPSIYEMITRSQLQPGGIPVSRSVSKLRMKAKQVQNPQHY